MIQRRLLHGLLLLITAICISPAHAAGGSTALVGKGDSAYVRKKYDSAVIYYSRASLEAAPDAALLYKLGNAHFRLGNTAEAVLAYERALKRRPGFAAAAENLAVLRSQIQPGTDRNDVFFMRWWQALTRPSLSDVWAMLAVACFCITLGALIWSRLRRKWPRWLWPRAIVGGMVLSFVFAVFAAASVGGSAVNTGIIMRRDAALQLAANGPRGSVIKLPEGLAVRVLSHQGAEWRVALADGREGLIQASDIALVE